MQTGSTDPSKAAARTRSRAKKGSSETLRLKPKQSIDESIVESDLSIVERPIAERIATAAYFLAEQRHFEPGHELEDWLTAERRICGLQS